MTDSGCPNCSCESCPCNCNHCDCCGHMEGITTKFRLSMCAGQGFKIRAIQRPYSVEDRIWFNHDSVFEKRPLMYPYKKYVPEDVHGGEA